MHLHNVLPSKVERRLIWISLGSLLQVYFHWDLLESGSMNINRRIQSLGTRDIHKAPLMPVQRAVDIFVIYEHTIVHCFQKKKYFHLTQTILFIWEDFLWVRDMFLVVRNMFNINNSKKIYGFVLVRKTYRCVA